MNGKAQATTPRLTAAAFPEEEIRQRARAGTVAVFPPLDGYGTTLYGAARPAAVATGRAIGDDVLERTRIVPPVFMPERLKKLIELGREPRYDDVCLDTDLGGLRSPLPLFVSAFGSTEAAGHDLGEAVARQAATAGLPLVVGENVVPVNGYRTATRSAGVLSPLLGRVRAYLEAARDDGSGGVVVQQSTEDADSEVWNLVYSDTATQPLLATGRLAFELKVGQGAKPGLGGMTVLDADDAARVAEQYRIEPLLGETRRVLRSSAPGTFTEEILRQQIRLMRNNFPRARVWVKLHPGRDLAVAAEVAWAAGADAVTLDGAEGGTGWAPTAFLAHVGLPLGECLRAVGPTPHCLLATGRMWEGSRIVKALALGARGAGLGRAALIATNEDGTYGLLRLVDSIALELRLLISALGKYAADALDADDVLVPTGPWHVSGAGEPPG